MFTHERHQLILKYLQKRPSTSVNQLQEELGVSRSTLRRDLVELEELGQILRVHGGVVHRDYLRGEPSYDRRDREATSAKRAIGETAAAQIPANSTVYLDAGTTCVEVGRQLAVREDINIFTHSVRFLIEAGDSAASITCVGGQYRAVSQALVGGLALDWLKHLRCDIAILGVSGLSDTEGASTTETSEAAVKQAILTRCQRSIIVADHRKWEQPAAINFASWSHIDTLVTDEIPEKGIARNLKEFGTRVITAS